MLNGQRFNFTEKVDNSERFLLIFWLLPPNLKLNPCKKLNKMDDRQVINVPCMCCHCTSKNNLLEWEISLRYLKYYFFFARVYRNILLKVFVCKSCWDKSRKLSKNLNRTLLSAMFIIVTCLVFAMPILLSNSQLIGSSVSNAILVLIMLLISLAIMSIPFNLYRYRESFWNSPRISFLPPPRIIFPNRIYNTFFESVNPNLKL